ncbi:hypothetical protein [Flavisolibacter ginsenosidimutans]|uniref:Uncharacterized protein n=1 Tax=Flavisolibacter ginsenosidimutans TaxID=661481 RepID=A0A5B8UIW3_9BACT|nr:hypothetical protein [Flavisolibacter ginsenosidimutans]QEC56518.1 hypothetical protein FSB75_11635 [Flavisolibacter ginsenosidimutans]
MELVMYVGFDMIDTIRLNTEKITEPGYVGSLKRELMQKHASQMQYLSVEPEFLIVQSVSQA